MKKIVIDELEKSPDARRLPQILFKDKLISVLLVLDAIVFVAGIVVFFVFKNSATVPWLSSVSCVTSIVAVPLFILLVCWWFKSGDRVSAARGDPSPSEQWGDDD